MRLRISKTIAILLLFVFLGAILRFCQLGSLPAVMHRDETSIGYNAYSLLRTGHDEHGVAWPVSFKAFGDYKLPGLIYATIPSIQAFGLNPFAIRFPTAFAAVLTIPALFWLVREIGWSKRIALLSALFVALDFWHISQARNAYEPILGLLFSIVGWASWLAARRNTRWYAVSLLSYVVGSLFYNIPFLVMPMLYTASWLLMRDWHKPLTIQRAERWTIVCLIVMLLSVFGLAWVTRGVNASRSNTTVFSHPDIVEQSVVMTQAGVQAGLPYFMARGLSHPIVLGSLHILKGYASAFDPTYLFFLGDHNPWHNLQSINLGDMNPALIFGLIVGCYVLIRTRQRTATRLTLMYVLLSPVISSLTIDAPITNRLLDFHIAVTIVAAVGAGYLLRILLEQRTHASRFALACGVFLYFGFFAFFVLRYFVLFNNVLPLFWNPGVDEMVRVVEDKGQEHDWVFITPSLQLGYTYFAFYTPFNPSNFQKDAKWHTEGFELVSEFSKYKFEEFPQWQDLSTSNVTKIFDDQHKRIMVVRRDKPIVELDTVWEQKDWKGDARWYIWQTDIDQAIFELQNNPATPDRTNTLNYLQSCKQGQCILD